MTLKELKRRRLEETLGCSVQSMTAQEWLDCAANLDAEGKDYVSFGEMHEALYSFRHSQIYFEAALLKEELENA